MNRSDFLAAEKAESAGRGRHWKSWRRAESDLRVSPGGSRVLAREITKGRGYNKGRAGKRKERKTRFIAETQPAGKYNSTWRGGITIRYTRNASRVTLDRKLTRVLSNFRATKAGGNEVARWIKDNGGISLSRLCAQEKSDRGKRGGRGLLMSEENDEGIGKWNFRDKWFCINFEFPRVFLSLISFDFYCDFS